MHGATIKKNNRQISMHSAGIKPAIPVIKRPQTYTLNRKATRIHTYLLMTL